MGYCSDNPAMECLTVDACSCALFERRSMRLRELSDSHGSQRNLQVDCPFQKEGIVEILQDVNGMASMDVRLLQL